jgi:hypothetical protein
MIWLVLPLLDSGDVLRLYALLATSRLVGDLGAFFEGLKPAAYYRAVVHEEIIAPVVRGDEAVAFIAVEPLDRSLGHVLEPAFLSPGLHHDRNPVETALRGRHKTQLPLHPHYSKTGGRSPSEAEARTPAIAFTLLHRLVNARFCDGEDIVISGGIGYPTPPL